MSNPGVILLSSQPKLHFRFDVEDNIGEAIHIHIQDTRLDFTINEFLQLANKLGEVIDMLLLGKGVSCNDFDAVFFQDLAYWLPELECACMDNVMLEELFIDTHDYKGNSEVKPLKYSRVYKSLKGDSAENNQRKQINYYRTSSSAQITNKERLEYNLEQIRLKGYPYDNDYITLLSDKNNIIDGQHRAACLYALYGNMKVPVRRLYFNKVINSEMSKRKVELSYKELEYKRLINSVGISRKLFLWGAGSGGQKMLDILYDINCNIDGIIDNDFSKHGQFIDGIEIYSPEKILKPKDEPRPFVVVCSAYGLEIKEQLEIAGFKYGRDFKIHDAFLEF